MRTYLWCAVGVVTAALGLSQSAEAHTETSTRSPTGLIAPRLLVDATPEYPESAKAEGLSGTVRVELSLTETGTVGSVRVLDGVRADLDAAAVVAAHRLRFTPALFQRRAIPCTIRFHFHFNAPAVAPIAPQDDEDPGEVAVVPTSSAAAPTALEEVVVQGKLQRRSASEVVRERAVLEAAPHRSADELLFTVPGVFITQHGGEGKAYQIFYRGFDAVHGQDVEIWAAGAPVNDVSNIHGQGYADLHFLPAETVRTLSATPGTFDPHQGDFAVAGTLRFELGLPDPGIVGKAELGSFGTKRLFLGYRPEGKGEATFGAVELYTTDGFGPSRAASRASGLGQWVLSLTEGTQLRLMGSVAVGQFASAGVLKLSEVESGKIDRFATYDPNQGGSSSRAQLVAELTQEDRESKSQLSTYFVLRSMRLREDFTGYLKDPSGDSEQQLNSALVFGATGSYRHKLHLFSRRDAIEAGFSARADWIEQSQRRLSVVDASVTADEVEAKVRAFDVAGFVDLALSPWERLTLRGGVRLDGLGYSAEDTGGAAAGQARSSLGIHAGGKGTIDLMILPELHALISYGDGFRSPQARSLSEGQTTPFTTARSGELGVQVALPFLRGSAAAFYTTLSDDLVFDQSTARNERVPATRRLGLSLEAETLDFYGLTMAGSLTFTDAAFTESNAQFHAGDLVPYAPQIVARIDAVYRATLGQLWERPVQAELGAALSVLARRPLPYDQLGHDVGLVDLRAELGVGPAALGLEIYNLLDSGWYDGEFVFASRFDPSRAAALVPQRMVTVGAPRTFMASLKLSL
ncbi:MAG: TonB-dependent receptor [Myxococcota bacterium]